MVLFSIACDTCASRLNVKQTGAIGQVLACPKCGSMVHVQPPEGWVDPTESTAPPRKPKPPRDPNDSQNTLSGEFDDLRTQSGLPAARKPRATIQAQPQSKNQQTAVGAAPEITTAPPVQESVDVGVANHWESDGSGKKSNSRALIAGIIGICLISLVIISYMMMQMVGKGTEPVADQTKQGEQASTPNEKNDTNQKEAGKKVEIDGFGDPVKNASNADENNTESTNTANDNSDVNNKDPKDKDPKDSANEPGAPNEITNDETGSDTTNITAETTGNTETSGIDEDAAIDNSLTMETDDEQTSILDDFKGIGELVLESGIDMDEYRDVADDDQTHRLGLGKVFVPTPKPLTVDPASSIGGIYPALAIRDKSLIEFSRIMFNISRVPVQLDSRSIIQSRLDPFAKVSAEGEKTSPSILLSEAIEPLQLNWSWNDTGTAIVIAANSPTDITRVEYELDQVLGITDQESGKYLINELQSIISPTTWSVKDGSGSAKIEGGRLVVEQTAEVQNQVQWLIDRLVIAANLKESPGDLNLKEQLATLYTRSRELLESEAVVNEIQQEPIYSILKKLQEQDGATLLMNWDELESAGWNPSMTIPWNSQGLTFEQTLRQFTNSIDLAYRMVKPNVFELTSKQRYWNDTRIEIYPCSEQLKKLNEDQIIQFLKEGVVADLPQNEFSRVVFVPQCDCIIALLPDPLHIRVEKIMEQLAE